jgi:protein-tyrosine phosphatase
LADFFTFLPMRFPPRPLSGVLRDRYGGRRAALGHLASVFVMRLGRFREYQAVDWSQVERLVFVCKGNICRSAYAEARASSAGFPAASFGIEARPDAPADPSATTHAAARNVSLSAHRTTPLRAFAYRPGDLLVCMEPPQAKIVAKLFPGGRLQVTLLGLWAKPARPWLFDPYGSGDGYWCTCLDTIDGAINRMLRACRQLSQIIAAARWTAAKKFLAVLS